MSYRLKFVEEPASSPTTRLDLDDGTIRHIERDCDIPAPDMTKSWATSAREDGAKMVDSKYELIPITLALAIRTSAIADLDSKVRDIFNEITRENYLEMRPEGAASSVFYKTFPYDGLDPGTLQRKLFRLSKFTWGLNFDLRAELPIAPAVKLTPVENLAPNWLFENRSGNDFDDWTESSSSGSVTANTTHYLQRLAGQSAGVSCELETTDAGGHAEIASTDYISITDTEHFNLIFGHLMKSGTGGLDVKIEEYNASNSLLNTITIEPTGASLAWRAESYVIHPYNQTSETYHWYSADVAKVKIKFRVDGEVAEWCIDGVFFTNSELLSGNELTNPTGMVFSPDDLDGDVPAPADIFLTDLPINLSDGQRIYIGGRKKYSADYVPYLEVDAGFGSLGNDEHPVHGDFRYEYIYPNLFLNPGFEDVSGSGNSSDWTSLTESRDATVTMETYTYNFHSGERCVHWTTSSSTNKQGVLTTTDYITGIDQSKDHDISIWAMIDQEDSSNSIAITIEWYNAANSLLSSTATTWNELTTFWRKYSYTIPNASIPATAVKAKMKVTGTVNKGRHVYADDARFQQSDRAERFFEASIEAGKIEGKVKPFWHGGKYSVSPETLNLILKGKILDSSDNEITEEDIIDEASLYIPSAGTSGPFYWNDEDRFEPISIPGDAVSVQADLSGLKQFFAIDGDENITAGDRISSDVLALIPTDNGWAEIHAADFQNIIIDCRSDEVAILRSYDGTLDKSAALPGASYDIGKKFKVDPHGTNMAILFVLQTLGGQSCYPSYQKIEVVYNPRFLVIR